MSAAIVVADKTVELTYAQQRVSMILAVESPEQAQYVRDWLTAVQTEADAIAAAREERLRPLLDETKAVRDEYRTAVDLCDAMVKHLKQLLGNYELANRQLQQEAFARAAAAHETGNHIEARAEVAASNELARNVKPEGVSVREVWTAEVIDAALVPREWCTPDEKRISAMARAVKGNGTPMVIPGVRYVKTTQVANRRSR